MYYIRKCYYFLPKMMKNFCSSSHFFSKKMSLLDFMRRRINESLTNDFVTLTMLWTGGPRTKGVRDIVHRMAQNGSNDGIKKKKKPYHTVKKLLKLLSKVTTCISWWFLDIQVWVNTFMCFNIEILKTINFLFVPNGNLMVFRCPNI